MLVIASWHERTRVMMAWAALNGGSTVLLAESLEEACAHLECETVLVRYEGREVLEPCSITAAIVMLGFDDGWQLCQRLHARGERIPVLWLVPMADYERALALDEGCLDRCHLVEPVDIFAVVAWLDHARTPRVCCQARRNGQQYALRPCETEVLTRHALHWRYISLAELAREMELHENTLRARCRRIESKAKTTIVRLAAEVNRHIGVGQRQNDLGGVNMPSGRKGDQTTDTEAMPAALNPAEAAPAVAVEHHASGRLDVAEAAYRSVLAAFPGSLAALQLLGVVSHQLGRGALAERCLREVL